ncbi:hypothetical protein Noda2021_10070 [Candidatus Dependentiae bacterium Noda2021]|nr:hypothetical protein Noda2021_10070 [Candidatus Dependentiae bacterium Noda2021]
MQLRNVMNVGTLLLCFFSLHGYKDDQASFLKLWCSKSHEEVESQSLKAMHEIMTHLRYWQNEEKKISTGLHKHVTTDAYAIKIRTNIAGLENEFNKRAHLLGTIHELKYNAQESSPELVGDLLKKTYVTLSHEVNTPPLQTAIKRMPPTSIQTLAQDTYSIATNQLPQSFKLCIDAYKKPSWFDQNKKHLLIAGVVTSSLLASYWIHRSQIAQACTRYTMILSNFLRDHIVSPLSQIKRIIVDRQSNLVMSQEAFDDTKRELEIILDELFQRVNPEMNAQERHERIKDITQNNNMGYLDKIWHDQFGNAFSKAFWHLYDGKMALLKSSSAQILSHKLQTYKILMQASRDLQLLLPMAALTPTALIGMSIYRLSQKSFGTLTSKQIPYLTIRPIKQSLIAIEKLVNNNNKDEKSLSATQLGQLLFHTNQLKTAIKKYKKIDLTLFLSDVAELESLDLTLAQKMAVIDRMYRTYDVLSYKI